MDPACVPEFLSFVLIVYLRKWAETWLSERRVQCLAYAFAASIQARMYSNLLLSYSSNCAFGLHFVGKERGKLIHFDALMIYARVF